MKLNCALLLMLWLTTSSGLAQTAYEFVNYGNYKYKNGDYQGAYLDYTKAIELSPNTASIYYNRGIVLKKIGHVQEAINDYSKAIQLRLNSADVFYNRGTCFQALGRYQEAIQDYNEAIEIKPNDYQAYNNRGMSLKHINLTQEAIKNYNMAIRIKPDDFQSYNNLGSALRDLKRYQEAIDYFSRAIQIKPDYYQGYFNLGLTYEDIKQWQQASNNFQKALQINPAYQKAALALARTNGEIQQKRTPKIWLLAVGIDNYQYNKLLTPLHWSVTNVERFEKSLLLSHLCKRNETKILFNIQANKEAILSSIEGNLCDTQKVNPEDIVIFYFIGHGRMLGSNFGICPYDYYNHNKLISEADIVTKLNKSPARYRFCLIESCKSESSPMEASISQELLQDYNIVRRGYPSNTVVLTSTKAGHASIEYPETGGSFSKYLLLGLQGEADGYPSYKKDHRISIRELFIYVKEKVMLETKGNQEPQINDQAYQADIHFLPVIEN